MLNKLLLKLSFLLLSRIDPTKLSSKDLEDIDAIAEVFIIEGIDRHYRNQ